MNENTRYIFIPKWQTNCFNWSQPCSVTLNSKFHTAGCLPLPSDWPSWTDSAGVLGCSWHAADGGLEGIHGSEHQIWSVKTSPNTPVRNNAFQTSVTILPLLLPKR